MSTRLNFNATKMGGVYSRFTRNGQSESVDGRNLKQCADHGTLQINRLRKHLKVLNSSFECDLFYFITRLFPKETAAKLIEDIKHSSDVHNSTNIVERICEAFLTEKDASWIKLYRALKEAEFDDVAEDIKLCFFNGK